MDEFLIHFNDWYRPKKTLRCLGVFQKYSVISRRKLHGCLCPCVQYESFTYHPTPKQWQNTLLAMALTMSHTIDDYDCFMQCFTGVLQNQR